MIKSVFLGENFRTVSGFFKLADISDAMVGRNAKTAAIAPNMRQIAIIRNDRPMGVIYLNLAFGLVKSVL